MNIYRIYTGLRGDEALNSRHKLAAELNGKAAFTDADLNKVLAYKRIPYHGNPKAHKVTAEVFATPDLGEKIRLLKRLNGVGVVVASAVLMFQNPYRHAEINHKTWNNLRRNHGFKGGDKDHRSDFSVTEYRQYLEVLASLANEYGMNIADVEYVLSTLD